MKEFLRNVKNNRNFMIGAIMVLSIVVIAMFANIISPFPYDEAHVEDRLSPPSSKYIFGTDDFGRDVLSRTIYGSRIALKVAIIAVSIQAFIGVTTGLVAGYFGGKIDSVISFFADLTWATPPMIMSMAVITMLGKGLNNVIIAIAIVSWAQYTRIVRAKTQSLKNMAFIETGISFNESTPSIIFRYIFPNIIPSVVVLASLGIPATITSTTALSFLGLGAQPPSPDWGLALSSSMLTIGTAPWLVIPPGLALVYTVFGFNLLGEGLRDLLDPRIKAR